MWCVVCSYKYGRNYSRGWRRRFDSSTVLAQMEELFELKVSSLRHLRNTFVNEMRRGLNNVGSTIKMIPSCVLRLARVCSLRCSGMTRVLHVVHRFVTELPHGSEEGEVWAMDLGGTNCRVVRYQLLGEGRVGEATEHKAVVPPKVCVCVYNAHAEKTTWRLGRGLFCFVSVPLPTPSTYSQRLGVCAVVLLPQYKLGEEATAENLFDWLVDQLEEAQVCGVARC